MINPPDQSGHSVRLADNDDLPYLIHNDNHISSAIMTRKVEDNEVLVLRVSASYGGWLRWGYFWDFIPFMNMLRVADHLQRQGFGRQLVTAWEHKMQSAGHRIVMTSTLADENAQHFYRKLGYVDTGALLLPDEATEIILRKDLA